MAWEGAIYFWFAPDIVCWASVPYYTSRLVEGSFALPLGSWHLCRHLTEVPDVHLEASLPGISRFPRCSGSGLTLSLCPTCPQALTWDWRVVTEAAGIRRLAMMTSRLVTGWTSSAST